MIVGQLGAPTSGLLVLTDRRLAEPRPLVDVVAGAVEAGARAVVLREKDLPRTERAALADELHAVLAPAAGLLIVASDPTIDADGVHLAAAEPLPAPGDGPRLVGRSCHSIAEVIAAAAEGCDYVTLSPVFASASKPGYGPALGVAVLAEASDAVAIPVFALGGVDGSTAAALAAAGIHRAAVMGAVMGAADPRAATHHLLDHLTCRAGAAR